MASIAQELEDDLKRLQYSGKTVTVKYKLHTYECKLPGVREFQLTPRSEDKSPVSKEEHQHERRDSSCKLTFLFLVADAKIALDLMKKELPVRIRLLGIRLSNLKDLTVPETGIKDVRIAGRRSQYKLTTVLFQVGFFESTEV